MKKYILFAALLALLLSGCAAKEAGEYRKISPEEAKNMMDTLEDYIVLDVRTKEEFDAGHIEGATLLPQEELAEQYMAAQCAKDAVILVYCQSGRRSELASNTLCKWGYSNVYDFGGLNDWPYETVTIEE